MPEDVQDTDEAPGARARSPVVTGPGGGPVPGNAPPRPPALSGGRGVR